MFSPFKQNEKGKNSNGYKIIHTVLYDENLRGASTQDVKYLSCSTPHPLGSSVSSWQYIIKLLMLLDNSYLVIIVHR